MALLDASIPTQANLGSELAEIHRKTREAVNTLSAAVLAGGLPGMTKAHMDVGINFIDVAGSIAINITLVGAANDLVALPNGYSGQFVILRMDEGEGPNRLTIKHNLLIINLQENLDFIMQAGDVLILLNVGGALGVQSGVWYQIHRQLYNAVVGLIDLNGLRYRLFIDNFGALNVVTPI